VCVCARACVCVCESVTAEGEVSHLLLLDARDNPRPGAGASKEHPA